MFLKSVWLVHTVSRPWLRDTKLTVKRQSSQMAMRLHPVDHISTLFGKTVYNNLYIQKISKAYHRTIYPSTLRGRCSQTCAMFKDATIHFSSFLSHFFSAEKIDRFGRLMVILVVCMTALGIMGMLKKILDILVYTLFVKLLSKPAL